MCPAELVDRARDDDEKVQNTYNRTRREEQEQDKLEGTHFSLSLLRPLLSVCCLNGSGKEDWFSHSFSLLLIQCCFWLSCWSQDKTREYNSLPVSFTGLVITSYSSTEFIIPLGHIEPSTWLTRLSWKMWVLLLVFQETLPWFPVVNVVDLKWSHPLPEASSQPDTPTFPL